MGQITDKAREMAVVADIMNRMSPEVAKEIMSLKQRPGDQPLPVKNDHPYTQDLLIDYLRGCGVDGRRVIPDVERRKLLGIERYGTALQPFNGRDFMRDAYEELMDAAVYLRGLIYEARDDMHRVATLVRLFNDTVDSIVTVRSLMDERDERNSTTQGA